MGIRSSCNKYLREVAVKELQEEESMLGRIKHMPNGLEKGARYFFYIVATIFTIGNYHFRNKEAKLTEEQIKEKMGEIAKRVKTSSVTSKAKGEELRVKANEPEGRQGATGAKGKKEKSVEEVLAALKYASREAKEEELDLVKERVQAEVEVEAAEAALEAAQAAVARLGVEAGSYVGV